MKEGVVIWGASGHALVIADILRWRDVYEIVGFIDDVNPERHNKPFCGATILGGQEQLDILLGKNIRNLIFGFGDGRARLKLSKLVQIKGFNLITAIHPQSTIASDVRVGAGCSIVAGAVINPGARIGENVIINTCASVDHECIIQDGVSIAPGAHLGGGVTIDQGVSIGIGATIRDHIHIGANSVIGAGSVVLNDIPADVVAYGSPAKVIRRVDLDETIT